MTDTSTIIPLPTPANPLIGRDRELDAITDMLQGGQRLVTITGIGGIGKTRLALQVALELEPEFAAGALLVPLAEIRLAAQIPGAIARKLGHTDAIIDIDRLVSMLGDAPRLLVLDNLEQIPDASAFVSEMIASHQSVTVLCTSQATLNIEAERVHHLGPMTTSGTDESVEQLRRTPAVELFLHRARTADAQLAIPDDDVSTIAEICTALEGIPLAIELAAARIKVLGPDGILHRLADRFEVLGGGSQHLPDRHRTMSNAIAWSYDLLDPDERRVFRYLGVYAGGISLDAIDHTRKTLEITQTSWDIIDSFVGRSLLRRVHAGEAPRYQMLQTLREFAFQQLHAEGDEFNARLAHASYVANLAGAAHPAMRGEEQAAWFQTLSDDADNIKAACEWAAIHRPEIPLGVIGAIWKFFEVSGSASYYGELGHTLDITGIPDQLLATGLLGVAALDSAAERGPDLTISTLERVVTIAKRINDTGTQSRAANTLGTTMMQLGKLDEALAHFHQAINLAQFDPDDENALFAALANSAIIEFHRGNYEDARNRMLKALPLAERAGNRAAVARVMVNLGTISLRSNDVLAAKSYQEQALEIAREIGNVQDEFSALLNLANANLALKDYTRAASLYQEAIAISQRTHNAVFEAEIRTAYMEYFLETDDDAGAVNQIVSIATLATNESAVRALVTCTGIMMKLAYESGRQESAAALLGGFQAWQLATSTPVPELIEETIETIAAIANSGDDPNLTQKHGAAREWTYEELRLATLRASKAYLRRAGQSELMEAPAPDTAPSQSPILTPREMQVLDRMALGESNPEIAAAMFISHRTISTHVSNILAKLNVNSRTAAVSLAMRDRII